MTLLQILNRIEREIVEIRSCWEEKIFLIKTSDEIYGYIPADENKKIKKLNDKIHQHIDNIRIWYDTIPSDWKGRSSQNDEK